MTTKVREAVQEAVALAKQRSHPELTPAHLLKALVDQDGSLVPQMLRSLGVDPATVSSGLDRELDRLPRAEGADLHESRDLARLFEAAEKEMAKRKDAYLSSEHLLLGAAQGAAGEVSNQLKRLGITPARVEEELT